MILPFVQFKLDSSFCFSTKRYILVIVTGPRKCQGNLEFTQANLGDVKLCSGITGFIVFGQENG